ncbi:MAG: hypothetical protein LBF41_03410, partial [Deltaproteobacteria bacterium]|nr:hypothetical protein [Deltaproteobacteria bacterium]
MIKKILVILVLFFLALVSGLALLFLAWTLKWSPLAALAGPFVFLGIPALWWAGSLFFSILGRRKLARSALKAEKTEERDAPRFGILRQDWQRGILNLRNPERNLKRDKLRDFPWILVAGPGDGGAGVMRESGLASDFGGDGDADKPRGCDWFCFSGAVYVAVKGLYGTGLDELVSAGAPGETGLGRGVASAATGAPGREREDFETLLDLLLKTGRKVPLSGIVLAVPAALLLPENEKKLREFALRTRNMTDGLARVLDVSPPVHVLLTGLAAFPALWRALRGLGEGPLPAGSALSPAKEGGENAGIRVIRSLKEDLRNLLLDSLGEKPADLAPLLTAPREASLLERPLSILMALLESDSPKGPAPVARGVWFTGAPSPGRAAENGERQSPGARGLRTLLQKVIPADGAFSRRLNLKGNPRQKRYVIGLGLWYAALLAAVFLVAANADYQRKMSAEANRLVFAGFDGARGDVFADLGPGHAFERAGRAEFELARLEDFKKSFWIRGIGDDRAETYLNELRKAFLAALSTVTNQIADGLEAQLARSKTPESPLYAITLRQLLWLYSVHDAADGGNAEELNELRIDFPVLPPDFEGETARNWNLEYARLLNRYFENAKLDPDVSKNGDLLARDRLRKLIERAQGMNKDLSFDWLPAWANALPELQSAKLADFWAKRDRSLDIRRILGPDDPAEVPAACTLEGRKTVFYALDKLREVYLNEDRAVYDETAAEFRKKYDEDCLNAWAGYRKSYEKVAVALISGAAGGAGGSEKNLRDVSHLPEMIEVLSRNLSPLFGSENGPAWLLNLELDRLLGRWAAARSAYDAAKDKGILKRFSSLGPAASNLGDAGELIYHRTDFAERAYAAEPHLENALRLMNGIVFDLSRNPDEAMRIAALNFGGPAALAALVGDGASASPSAPGSPGTNGSGAAGAGLPDFEDAERELGLYAKNLYSSAGSQVPEDLNLGIHSARLESLEKTLVRNVAKQLDALWEREVLLPVRFLSEDEARKVLYGPDGLMTKFMTTRAAPFAESKGALGFAPKLWRGEPFPFTDDFLNLLSKGAGDEAPVLDSYEVKISVSATSVDPGALERPVKTTVSLVSPDSVQTLENYNYPVSGVFEWKPSAKSRASLEIDFPSVTLRVAYDGDDAFPHFLNDLISGGFVLKPQEFPDHRDRLLAMGITEIRVMARADGALPVVNFLKLSKSPLPASIIK